MAVDTAVYVNQFDLAKPTGGDQKSEGDDNFRHIKTVLKTTFPNVSGAVTPTHTQLNYVTGVTSSIQTQLDAKSDLTHTAGAIGSYLLARASAATSHGASISGANLTPAGIASGGAHVTTGVPMLGTWRCMGYVQNSSDVSLFMRIS